VTYSLFSPIIGTPVLHIFSAPSERKNSLDKNAFLQLLTTQMKYQDPLNPNTDTQYIAQLATFSQLEQLQNLSTVTTNTQAFNLVGKDVIIKAENSAGNTTYINGKVDFVNMSGTKTQLSINGSMYNIDQLDTVIDDAYIAQQNLPGVTQAVTLKYDAANPKDQTFDVKLGSADTIADKAAIAINDQLVDQNLVTVKGNKVTISKSAFTGLENGTYKISVVFNDSKYTTVKDKVTLQVQNAADKTDEAAQTAGTDQTSGNTTNTGAQDSAQTTAGDTANA
jgi:flagellar basal-body rod modification protein FlgD